jgi:hypothetical protein
VAVDLEHVRERPGIEIVADLAQKLAVGVELQELRRGSGIGRPGGVASGQYEDMALGVHRDPTDFAQIHVVGKLQRIGHRFEMDDRRSFLLRGCRRTQKHEQTGDQTSHDFLPRCAIASDPRWARLP